MAKPKADKVNGVTQAEQAPVADDAGDVPPTGQHETPQDLALPQGEPGPEDFERHSGARLIEDHAADLALEIDVQRRIRNRGPVIAARALKGGGKNPVVKIGSRVFTPRKRPEKAGGGIGLAEVGERSEASLD
jgi:hypothetical protein